MCHSELNWILIKLKTWTVVIQSQADEASIQQFSDLRMYAKKSNFYHGSIFKYFSLMIECNYLNESFFN